MRIGAIPFRFRVLTLAGYGELIFLPKLADEDLDSLTSNLLRQGYGEPKVTNDQPKILRYALDKSVLRLMPRGLLLGPPGTFERLGASLELHLSHPLRREPRLSWLDNDYQRLVPSQGDLVYHSKGRHVPSAKRFSFEVSRNGSTLAADEVLMIAATAEVCGAQSLELLTSHPKDLPDLSPPMPLAKTGFLHHVSLPTADLLAELDGLVQECLRGACPVSPLSNSTIVLKHASLPSPEGKGLENVISALENWVSDLIYFAPARRTR
jgi:hypothetical protein